MATKKISRPWKSFGQMRLNNQDERSEERPWHSILCVPTIHRPPHAYYGLYSDRHKYVYLISLSEGVVITNTLFNERTPGVEWLNGISGKTFIYLVSLLYPTALMVYIPKNYTLNKLRGSCDINVGSLHSDMRWT